MTAVDVYLDDPNDLLRGRQAAERVRAASLPGGAGELDLGLLKAAEDAYALATNVVAMAAEARERLWAGQLGTDARYDLGSDLLEAAARIQSFALAVRA